jgi:acetolactate synthase-1/2/3 large subunit
MVNNFPVVLLGNGVRGEKSIIDYFDKLGIPILLSWMALDIFPEDHPYYCGRPGILGGRAANIIQQKATLLITYGCRLDSGQVANSYETFAPNAHKLVYDIDPAESKKFKNFGSSWIVNNLTPSSLPVVPNPEWMKWCKELYNKFRPELDGVYSEQYVDPFSFTSYLSSICTSDDIIATGSSGQNAEVMMQTFKVKKGQRVTNGSTLGAMGADIPMAIGACIASGRKRTICVTGDGGFMQNIQELEVIKRLGLPIKFFVFSNNGYGSIRSMQELRFGNLVGCDPSSGFTIPKIEPIIRNGFGLQYQYFNNMESMRNMLWFDSVYPVVYELNIDPNYKQYPKVMSNDKLEPDLMHDMTPKLGKNELEAIMNWGN